MQDMGKVEAGKLDLESRAFDLNELSSDARLFATAAKKKGLRFVEDVDEFDQQVMGDMPRLRQVLTNLLSNAVKVRHRVPSPYPDRTLTQKSQQFTKSGSITLRVKKLAEDGRSVRVCWTVQDTGVGIRKEAISQLFKPFQCVSLSSCVCACSRPFDLSQSSGRLDLATVRRHGSRPLDLEKRELLSCFSPPDIS